MLSRARAWELSGRTWDVRTGRQLLEVTTTAPVEVASYSANGSLFVTGGNDDAAHIWSARTGQELMTMSSGDYVVDAQFSPDGSRVVTASYDGSARVWSTELTGPLPRLQRLAKGVVTRPLTKQERATFLAGIGV